MFTTGTVYMDVLHEMRNAEDLEASGGRVSWYTQDLQGILDQDVHRRVKHSKTPRIRAGS